MAQCSTLSLGDFPEDGKPLLITTRLASTFKVDRVRDEVFWVHPCPDIPSGTVIKGITALKNKLLNK